MNRLGMGEFGRCGCAVAILCVCAVETAPAQSFAIRAKAVYTAAVGQSEPIANGIVIVRNGRIVAVGGDLDVPRNLPLYEYPDGFVCPGFVNAASGLDGQHAGPESVGAAYRALDAFDPYANFKRALALGTTTVHLDPGGHRLVTGVGAIVKLAGPPGRRVLRAESDLNINLAVFGPPDILKPAFYASSDVAHIPMRRQRPASRLTQFLELEQRIADANRAMQQMAAGESVPFDMHAAAFADAWLTGMRLRIQARRAVDIEQTLAFVARHKRDAYLVGLTESGELIDALLDSGLPTVLRIETRYSSPAKDLGPSPDVLKSRRDTAARIAAAVRQSGAALRLALAGREDDPFADLQLIAATAAAGGMSRSDALAAITRIPAEILGIDKRVGSLAPGKDADLLVLSRPPFETNSHVLRAWVSGRVAFEPPKTDAIVVHAGTVWVGDGRTLHDASVLLENGKVRAVGLRVPQPRFAKVIDAGPDGFVAPGFIDAHGHLGLERDRTQAGPDLPIDKIVGVPGREFLRVARAGVTSVMLAAYNSAARGSRIAAIKTFGDDRRDMVTRATAGLKFSFRGRDPLLGVEALRGVLEAGKKYAEKWKKYAEELKKWKAERASGKKTDAKPKTDVVEEKREGKPDPITGTWEFKISGGPMPQDLEGTMKLRLTGSKIEGRMTQPGSGEEVAVNGTLKGKTVDLEADTDLPIGKPHISAELDSSDHMTGQFKLGSFTLEFEASRTDKSPVEFSVKVRRGRGKDGRPEPPPVDEALEPFRDLLAGKIPAVVDVTSDAGIRAVLKLFVEGYKIPVILLNADDASFAVDEIARRHESVGVIPPPRVVRVRDRAPYVESADLAGRGVPIAMQSNAEDGAYNLPLVGRFAAREGLGGDAALRALTIDAARLYRIADRIGSLEPGKDADVVIFSGHPFDTDSRLVRVIVGGKEVPNE